MGAVELEPIGAVAIIGASFAGLNALDALLESDDVTSVTVFSGEPLPPCDRPALSKELLTGLWSSEQTALAVPDDQRIRWRRERVAGLDPANHALTLSDGTVESFPGGVVIAAGTRPRSFPGDDLAGVHVVRTLEDAVGLREDISGAPLRVVVVGGGFIGMETAAACILRGHAVTVLETASAPFERIVGAEVGDAIVAPLLRRGIELRTGVGVSHVRGHEGHVDAVVTADGEIIPADVVVLGVGVVPALDWAEGSGFDLTRGVACDQTLLVAPRVVAAGDIALWPNARFGETRRVEHWDNAVRQGHHAGRRLLAEHGRGEAAPFAIVPWVWSDQLENKVAIVGSTVAFDEWVLADGDLDSDRFLILYRRGDELTAVLGMNRIKELTRLRRRLTRPVSWAEALAEFRSADPAPVGR